MTRRANARIAGIAYLFYIAVAFPSMLLMNRATSGEAMAEKLVSMGQHVGDVRLAAVLTLLGTLSALTLAVTLFAITRDQDPDLAMMGLACRVGEGVIGAAWIPATMALLAIVIAAGPGAADAAATQALAAFVLKQDFVVSATFFAIGSTLFSWLLLRGRMIPTWLAWTGVVGSALLVVGLLLQLGAVLRGPITQFIWIPVALFELTLGPWLIIKGAAAPVPR